MSETRTLADRFKHLISPTEKRKGERVARPAPLSVALYQAAVTPAGPLTLT